MTNRWTLKNHLMAMTPEEKQAEIKRLAEIINYYLVFFRVLKG